MCRHTSGITTDVEATVVGVATTNQVLLTGGLRVHSAVNYDPPDEEKRKVLVICTLDDEPVRLGFVKSQYLMTDDLLTLFDSIVC